MNPFLDFFRMIPASIRNGALLVLLGAAGGFAGGYGVFHPRAGTIDPPAVAQRQGDGSLVLQRAPDPAAKPAAEIPKGGKVERVVRLTVQPTPVHEIPPAPPTAPEGSVSRGTSSTAPALASATVATPPGKDSVVCPPVSIELDLVRMPDRSRRVVASAKGGTVLGGVDIPVEAEAVPPSLRWSVGAIADPVRRTVGGFVSRDLGPFRALATVLPDPGGGGVRTGIGIGIRF